MYIRPKQDVVSSKIVPTPKKICRKNTYLKQPFKEMHFNNSTICVSYITLHRNCLKKTIKNAFTKILSLNKTIQKQCEIIKLVNDKKLGSKTNRDIEERSYFRAWCSNSIHTQRRSRASRHFRYITI